MSTQKGSDTPSAAVKNLIVKPTSFFNLFFAGVMLLTLPPLVYYMWICVVHYEGAIVIPKTMEELRKLVSYVEMPTPLSVGIFVGWYGWHILCQIFAPGKWVEGTPLSDGTKLKYKLNGWVTWWATWIVLGAMVYFKVFSASALYEQFGPLLTTINIFTWVFCLYLYYSRRWSGKTEQISGNAMYDYWMGTCLNPRIGTFDLKLFCEARPGLIGWVAINLSLAAKQYEMHGYVTLPMILVCAFHFLYIADYYYHEEAILTTWDIRHENFGYMLCWGDLVWVPFTYTIQAFYLIQHTHSLPIWGAVLIVLLNMAGYFIFRSVNIQKHRFRRNPERPIWGKPPEFIKTKKGTLLLVSGWWGLARHMNYMGDLMMALAWCLPCLFGHAIPYFYITYFTILLVHRERRDNDKCAERYGEDWETYTKRVKWRIVPGIY
jgi:protein-S-isoprenylcysteine O-methyltransferase Ste14